MDIEELLMSVQDQQVIRMTNNGPGPGGELPIYTDSGKIGDSKREKVIRSRKRKGRKYKKQTAPIGCFAYITLCGIACIAIIMAAAYGALFPSVSGLLILILMISAFLKSEEV